MLAEENETSNHLNDLIPFINEGVVIPIISNSFRVEEIFRNVKELTEKIPHTPQYSDEYLTISEQLTKEWADSIQYPMPDDYNLARVAQYYQVSEKDVFLAKTKYLRFLNLYLLNTNKEVEYEEIVSQLKLRTQERTFSDIVSQLDHPRFPQGVEDPLRLLARLPLSIYITTSCHSFLERALEAENKKPRTQVCFWGGGRSRAKAEHWPDPDFEPTPMNPAVYHLYGLENYPQTLVLSEDDYMNFLISVAEDTNTQNPIIPLKLREVLAESRLILLGYHMQDWEFRTLFRFILKFRKNDLSPRSTVIQLKPRPKKTEDEKRSLAYLLQYFDKKQFDVEWTSAEEYIQRFWDEWSKYNG
ncbi:MAG TPA: SIR2 family protein [Anaerolineales bacterium]|nr:SIR2 family protein [Anaerolineales bacterium]